MNGITTATQTQTTQNTQTASSVAGESMAVGRSNTYLSELQQKHSKVSKATATSANEKQSSAKTAGNTEPALKVSISAEAKQLYNQEKNSKLTPQQDVLFFKAPEKGSLQVKAREELPVMEVFREGTAEHFIFSALDGNVENAYEMAQQLGDLIYGHGNDKDAETSATDRETGKKLAEYIAQNYLDDPEEAKSFLEGIAKFADKSEMRDKGYVVIIGSDIEPFKPKYNDLKRFAEEEFGYTDMDWSDTEKSSKVIRAFTKKAMSIARKEAENGQYSEKTLSTLLNYDSNPDMYKEEKTVFNKAFDENEKRVQDIINAIKNKMGGIAVDDNFFANMNTVLGKKITMSV